MHTTTMTFRQLVRFGLVGGVAASVHMGMVVVLVSGLDWPPLWANLVGFSSAFPVSYLGQYTWTFAGHNTAHRQSLARFLATALMGLLLNEVSYGLCLSVMRQHYFISLLFALLIAAAGVYLLARYWVFSYQTAERL